MVELNVSAPNTAMAVILGIVVFAILLLCCVVLQFRLSRRRARLVPPAAMAKPPEGAGFIEVDTGGFGDATEKGELDDSILSSVRQQENEKEPGGRIAPVGGRIKPFEEAVAGSGAGARGHGVPAGEGAADNTAADTPETSAPAEKRSFWGRFFGGKQKTKGARVGADVESGEAAAETCGLEQPSAAWPGGDDSKYGGRRGEGLSSEAGTEEEAMSGCEGVLTGQDTQSRVVPSVAVSFAGSAEADGARTSAQMQGGHGDGVASRVAAHSLGQLRDRSVERGLGPTVQPQSGLAPVVSVYDHQAVERYRAS